MFLISEIGIVLKTNWMVGSSSSRVGITQEGGAFVREFVPQLLEEILYITK